MTLAARPSTTAVRRFQDVCGTTDLLAAALVQQARTDPLAGLRATAGTWPRPCWNCTAAGAPAPTATASPCDIDLFKSYNHHYGHPAGDRALRQVASSLREQLREQDHVFRYGGEELLVLPPCITADQAMVALERVRAAVRAAAVPHPGSPPWGADPQHRRRRMPPDREITSVALLDEADAALYTAKQAGRDAEWSD